MGVWGLLCVVNFLWEGEKMLENIGKWGVGMWWERGLLTLDNCKIPMSL